MSGETAEQRRIREEKEWEFLAHQEREANRLFGPGPRIKKTHHEREMDRLFGYRELTREEKDAQKSYHEMEMDRLFGYLEPD